MEAFIEEKSEANEPVRTNNSSSVGSIESNLSYKEIAIKLWKLLDDIDTAEDIFKPTITNHFKYVNKKHSQRFKYFKSDGYNLFKDGVVIDEEPPED